MNHWQPTPADLDQIIGWVSEGLSVNAIGDKIGISGRTIDRYQRRHPQFAERLVEARSARRARRPDHGTSARYNGWGCRCDQCRTANNDRMRQVRVDLRSRNEQAPHGTRTGYVNWSCRCDECRRAGSKANRSDREKRMAADPARIPHGTTSGYINWRCRCEGCRTAVAEYKRNHPRRAGA